MPSPQHDTLNLMFRNRPELAVEMLRDQLGVNMPEGLPVQLADNELNDRPSKDCDPDTVVTIGPRHNPVHAIVVEIQAKKDAAKRRQLPRYVAALWLQLDCPVSVLVISPNADTAAWAAEPIPTTLSSSGRSVPSARSHVTSSAPGLVSDWRSASSSSSTMAWTGTPSGTRSSDAPMAGSALRSPTIRCQSAPGSGA